MSAKFELPLTIKNRLLKKYRESSIKTFTTSIKRIYVNAYDPPINQYKPQVLYDFDYISKYISKSIPLVSQKNIVAAILAVIKVEDNPSPPQEVISNYEKLFNKLASKVTESVQYKEPSQSEEENWISYKEVYRKFEQVQSQINNPEFQNRIKIVTSSPSTIHLKYSDLAIYQHYIILAFYIYLPPLRSEEYYNTIILTVCNTPDKYSQLIKATKRNIIDLENNKLVSGIYKTSDKYGLRVIDLPQQLVKIIKTWYRLTYTFSNQNLLFNLNTYKPLTQQAFTEQMFRIFSPNRISSSMLRKIFISEFLAKNPSAQERKKLAHTMGHSLEMQEFIYSRFKSKK